MKQLGIAALILVLGAGCASTADKKSEELSEREQLNLQLGVRYMQKQDFVSAAEKLRRVLETSPEMVVVHRLLGLTYSKLEDRPSAERHFAAALKYSRRKHREYAEVNNSYGVYLCQQQRYDEALDAFRLAFEHKQYANAASAYENAAFCALQSGKDEQAEEFLRQALEMKPALPRSLLAMAKLMLKQQNALLARAYIQRYEHTVSKPVAEALWLGFQVESQLKNDQGAAMYRARLKAEYPGSEFITRAGMQ